MKPILITTTGKLAITAVFTVALFLPAASCLAQGAKKPNIVVIWGDDIACGTSGSTRMA